MIDLSSLFGSVLLLAPSGLALMLWVELLQHRRALRDIHNLVNSQLTQVKADLEIANGRIEGLLSRIETLTAHPPGGGLR